MKTTILFLLAALVFSLGAFAEPGRGDDGPGSVKAAFAAAVATAEAAWREDAVGALRAYASRLLDAERGATREENLAGANRVRDLRRSVERLAAEAATFESLVGLLPVPGRSDLAGAAKDARAAGRETMDAANARYREALERAAEAAVAKLDRRIGGAADEADLDRANALAEAKRVIELEVKLRLTPLAWQEITFPTKTRFRFRGEAWEWRVEGNELVLSRFANEPHMDVTLATWFDRIESVTVRGRIRKPHSANFRMSVGPLNMILNWECGPKSIFRWYDAGGEVGDRLEPGRYTDITVRQTSPGHSDVLFDGRRVWSTEHGLFGSITIYTFLSAIGVTDIRILGVPNRKRTVMGPMSRLW